MRKRILIFCLFLIMVPAAGVVYARHWAGSMVFRSQNRRMDDWVSGTRVVLGSIGYINRIEAIEKKSGDRAALRQIMKDVEQFGAQLDGNEAKNHLRLYKCVSRLVYKIGSVDMETHYFRNKLNRAPWSLAEMLHLNASLPASKRWHLQSVGNSIYHIQGKDGIYNLKFVSSDGFCEAVYNKAGELLTENNDPVNMGTFNYGAGIPISGAHKIFDIDPYLKWGNASNSPQKGEAQIKAGIKLAGREYHAHAAEVNAYREKVMGGESKKAA